MSAQAKTNNNPCEKCGARNAHISTVREVLTTRGKIPSIHCLICRRKTLKEMAQAQERQRRASAAIIAARGADHTQPDYRLERWLVTKDDVVRQNRRSHEHPWTDTPDDQPDRPPQKMKSKICSVCHQSSKDYRVYFHSIEKNPTILDTCKLCAAILMREPQLISREKQKTQKRKRQQPPSYTTLAPCPGCHSHPVEAERPRHPLRYCEDCTEATLDAIEAIIPETARKRQTNRIILRTSPYGCQRCNPAKSRTNPNECLLCRTEYDLMLVADFPLELKDRPNKTGCETCPSKETSVIACSSTPKGASKYTSVCATCARISRDYYRFQLDLLILESCL